MVKIHGQSRTFAGKEPQWSHPKQDLKISHCCEKFKGTSKTWSSWGEVRTTKMVNWLRNLVCKVPTFIFTSWSQQAQVLKNALYPPTFAMQGTHKSEYNTVYSWNKYRVFKFISWYFFCVFKRAQYFSKSIKYHFVPLAFKAASHHYAVQRNQFINNANNKIHQNILKAVASLTAACTLITNASKNYIS